MTFAELLQEVYDLTGRSDRVAETKSAIKAATLKAHKLDFFSKDIFETGIEFTETNFKQSLDVFNLISNYRALKYLKRVTDENDEKGKAFTVITPEETLDSYGRNKSDVVYVAGRVLEIRSSVTFDKLLMGCYVFPVITEATYASWVADLYPYAIIFEAARIVFKTLSDAEQVAAYKELVSEEYVELRASAVTDVGS